jgi:ATP-dependent Clp protease ATP-binding subunit ClpA
MFERFAREARQVALQAQSVAAGLGASSVEAEHLLVSIAGTQHPAGAALREVGLEPAELHAAIQRDGGVDVSSNCRRAKLGWGASAKQGLERALEEAKRRGDRKIGCEHILLGLLRAEHGTVPRLLAAEGIDRDELTRRL